MWRAATSQPPSSDLPKWCTQGVSAALQHGSTSRCQQGLAGAHAGECTMCHFPLLAPRTSSYTHPYAVALLLHSRRHVEDVPVRLTDAESALPPPLCRHL